MTWFATARRASCSLSEMTPRSKSAAPRSSMGTSGLRMGRAREGASDSNVELHCRRGGMDRGDPGSHLMSETLAVSRLPDMPRAARRE